MARVRCLGPCRRIVTPYKKGRCRECYGILERDRDRKRKRQRPWYGRAWSKVSRDTINAHVRRYGYRCPLCDRAHPQHNPLTTDHVKARTLAGGLRVMCRICNSSKGATTDRRKRT